MTRKIILIDGMPTVGKSTIAEQLSAHYGLPWMSSDQIREIMKSAIDPASSSVLNSFVDMTASDYFGKFDEFIVLQKYNPEMTEGMSSAANHFIERKPYLDRSRHEHAF